MDPVNFAVVGFDAVKLLIPQRAIATIEMIDSLEPLDDVANAVGSIAATDRRWPVFVLNAEFELQARCSTENKYCVAFNIEGQAAFALACDEVSSLTLAVNEKLSTLPDCLRNPGNPLAGLLLREGRVMLYCEESSMLEYLSMGEAA